MSTCCMCSVSSCDKCLGAVIMQSSPKMCYHSESVADDTRTITGNMMLTAAAQQREGS
jgi:hypothetical protein